jgi:hypothetical protein
MAEPASTKSAKDNGSARAGGQSRSTRRKYTAVLTVGVFDLQHSIGNQAVGRLLEESISSQPSQMNQFAESTERNGANGSKADSNGERGDFIKRKLTLQTKLTVSKPGDRYEQEADQTADEVMRAPEPEGRRNPRLLMPAVQRTTSEGGGTTAPPIIHNVLSSPGHPLDSATRAFFEPKFGRDFSQARIHADAQAAESARAVSANAFTVGWDLVFGAGKYAPETDAGKRLLAHELSHVIQQTPTAGEVSSAFSPASSGSGTVARAVASNYSEIKERLTYGFLDWAITDKEAQQALEMLKRLKPKDLKDTVQRMEADGLVDRLLENISNEDQTAYAPLIQSIQEERSTSQVTAHIESLLSYGLLDWAITDEEAHLALETLKSLQGTPDRLKQVVRIISEKQFQRLFKQLSDKDLEANKKFLQDLKVLRATGLTRADARDAIEAYKKLSPDERLKYLEKNYPTGTIATMLKALAPLDAADKYADEVREILRWVEESETRKASGMSDKEMAEVQAKYMESKRTKLAEEKIKKETPKGEVAAPPTAEQKKEAHEEIVGKSSVKKKPKEELNLIGKDDEKKRKWEARGQKVVKDVLTLANAKYPELKLKEANFKADFDAVEQRGKSVLAFGDAAPDGTLLAVYGYAFVEAGEADAAYVMSVVVHEIFGHPEFGKYGTEYHLKLYDDAAAKMADYTQPTGDARTSEIDNFAYQGTEIYSLLRSLPYHTPIKEKDKGKKLSSVDPKNTVRARIGLIKKNWDPKLAPALVRGLYVRFRLDPRITPEALDAFKDGVREVFKEEAKEILK